MQEVAEGKDYSFPKEEEKLLDLWNRLDAFKEQLKRTEGKPEYVFFDGPPFATGLPHYGHILAGTLKDIVTRYASATGHHVIRRFGWDCHGLPVEYEIDKKLNIKTRDDVMAMGIDKYNEECRSIVMRYSKEWEKTVHRLGRWIDFENDYKTLDPGFMESVWWVFKQLFDKGLVYKGFKVMPFSTACSTPLSNFEAGLNYKDVADPAVMVSFPIVGDADEASLVAWTTTPWTLPSNLALCVHPTLTYVRVRDPEKKRVLIVAEARLSAVPGAVPKLKKGAKKDDKPEGGFEVLATMPGSSLVGLTYTPLFPYFVDALPTAFRVVSDTYVTDDSGTGVVHQAPAFGEDDYRVCIAAGIVEKGGLVPCPVDYDGRFTAEVPDFQGMHVKAADKDIVAHIKAAGRLVDNAVLNHSYPFCWRSDTPLIYRAVPSWFVAVESIKDKLLANNAQTYWVPSYVKDKRFHNWLEGAHDWAVSRSRFWGTPIPMWMSEDGEEMVCVGSVAELEELTGHKATDLHRHFIDHLTIPSKTGRGVLKRVDDVFDCWFESGSMPYGQLHYPFENKELFEGNFPADFVAEGLDQTRGWFYTLMVLSTALFDKPAFKNLVCNGLVLASDGKKMSKRLKNYPDPTEVIDKYGADALRLYLINSPVVRAEPLKFKEEGVFGVVKDVFLPWYNAYRFLVQNVVRAGIADTLNTIDVSKATNVLDRWISAAARSLTNYVRTEMTAYRLYTVVPYLVKFIDNLTNVYVRFNRKRLKGSKGPEDCALALASLFHVLLTVCKVMAPFTPFLTEQMYQNLKHCLPAGAPESIHWVDFPATEKAQAHDERIQASVSRMQSVIELGRTLRERHVRPVKSPLRGLTVVHPDPALLADISGELAEYVCGELNVRNLTTCVDPLKYCDLRAEANFATLGRKVGRSMAAVAAAVKGWGLSEINAFEASGSATVEGHQLEAGDVKVFRDFSNPDNLPKEEVDASGDGDLLVVMDLRVDSELQEAGLAREVVNRFQKLRKAIGLVASDAVELYYRPLSSSSSDNSTSAASASSSSKPAAAAPTSATANGPTSSTTSPVANGPSTSHADPSSPEALLPRVLAAQAAYLRECLGMPLLPLSAKPSHALVLASEPQTVGGGGGDGLTASFEAVIALPAVTLRRDALLAAVGGSANVAEAVRVVLASRDLGRLRSEAESARGKVAVKVDGHSVSLTLGKELFFSAAEAAEVGAL